MAIEFKVEKFASSLSAEPFDNDNEMVFCVNNEDSYFMPLEQVKGLISFLNEQVELFKSKEVEKQVEKLRTLPKILPAMDLVLRIDAKLTSYEGNTLAYSIKNAIGKKMDNLIILKDLKEMAQDNRKLIENILGEPITSEILNFS